MMTEQTALILAAIPLLIVVAMSCFVFAFTTIQSAGRIIKSEVLPAVVPQGRKPFPWECYTSERHDTADAEDTVMLAACAAYADEPTQAPAVDATTSDRGIFARAEDTIIDAGYALAYADEDTIC